MSHPSDLPAGTPVLLFDGECGLCRRVVRWLLRNDMRGELRFAPLQGRVAQDFLRARGLPTDDFDSLVFVPDWSRRGPGEIALRTDGVVAALRVVGAARRAAFIAAWPRPLRDAGYRVIARWRHRIFGAGGEPAALPSEWAARFLP
jgi:predicted DCC family thiol-disulfide oxidoreductase YuxK